MTRATKATLLDIITKHSLTATLEAIAEICDENASEECEKDNGGNHRIWNIAADQLRDMANKCGL